MLWRRTPDDEWREWQIEWQMETRSSAEAEIDAECRRGRRSRDEFALGYVTILPNPEKHP